MAAISLFQKFPKPFLAPDESKNNKTSNDADNYCPDPMP